MVILLHSEVKNCIVSKVQQSTIKCTKSALEWKIVKHTMVKYNKPLKKAHNNAIVVWWSAKNSAMKHGKVENTQWSIDIY